MPNYAACPSSQVGCIQVIINPRNSPTQMAGSVRALVLTLSQNGEGGWPKQHGCPAGFLSTPPFTAPPRKKKKKKPRDTAHGLGSHAGQQDPSSGGGGRRGIVQIPDLEDHLHVLLQGDALVGGQRQQPAVIHDLGTVVWCE